MFRFVQRKNEMRIVGGKYRSLKINWPEDNVHIRPTKDRIRESIFSIINKDIDNSYVLDLYSGSGSMGLEALSRGAKFACFVDNNKVAIKTTKENISSLKIKEDEYLFLAMDDLDALTYLSNHQYKFNIVFLDPPYAEGKYENIINLLLEKSLLYQESIIVIECNRNIDIDENIYIKRKDYKYGKVQVIVLRLK